MAQRFFQRLFDWPTGINAPPQGLWTHAYVARPFEEAHGSAIIFDNDITPAVLGLCSAISPPDVIRFVRSVVVNTVHRVTGGICGGKVFDKIPNIMPALTHYNPPSPIVCISGMGGIVTPSHHAEPNWEQWVLGHTMRSFSFCRKFAVKASARLSSAISQIGGFDLFVRAALAPAQKYGVPLNRVPNIANHSPTPESLATDVFVLPTFSHGGPLNSLSWKKQQGNIVMKGFF
jgi:hypothetical protein